MALIYGVNYGVNYGVDPIWLDNVHCTGTETTLASCRHNGFGRHNCARYQDVGVSCSSKGTAY